MEVNQTTAAMMVRGVQQMAVVVLVMHGTLLQRLLQVLMVKVEAVVAKAQTPNGLTVAVVAEMA